MRLYLHTCKRSVLTYFCHLFTDCTILATTAARTSSLMMSYRRTFSWFKVRHYFTRMCIVVHDLFTLLYSYNQRFFPSQRAMIFVAVTPEAVVSSESQVHAAGGSFSLQCRSWGVPQPRVRWLRNEQPLVNDPPHLTLLCTCRHILL